MPPFACFKAPGRWYRGNCHTHTLLSDGKASAAETAAAYRQAGYDFLVLTDHRKTHESPESLGARGFLVIGGCEIHMPPKHLGNQHHLVAIGVKTPPDGRALKTARAAIRWVHAHRGLCYYAHPYWTGHNLDHTLEGIDALGVEVFNSVCEGMRGLGHSNAHWDQMLSRGVRWQGLATDDTHKVDRDAFGGWIMVKAPQLTQSAILAAMRAGRFYATQGPEIRSITMARGVARIDCSPVREVVWHGQGPSGFRFTGTKESPLQSSEFAPKPDSTCYLRVEIIDEQGRKAWSNPIYWNKKTRRWSD